MTQSDEGCDEGIGEYYNRVKDALTGLFEVLSVVLEPDNILYKCGIDNLEALKIGLIELLKKDYDVNELQEDLLKIEFNVKKSLFFENPKKGKTDKKKDEEKTI